MAVDLVRTGSRQNMQMKSVRSFTSGRRAITPSSSRAGVRQILSSYALALLLCGAAFALSLLLQGEHDRTSYFLIVPAIGLSAWLFGRGPAIVCSLASIVAAWYLITPPRFSFFIANASDGSLFAAFVITVVLTNVVTLAFRSQQEKVRYSEELFRSMYVQAAVGIEQISADGRLLMVNNALCRMLNRSESELLQKTCRQITHPDDCAAEQELLNDMLAGGRDSYKIEKRYLSSDGSIVWVNVVSSAVRDRLGQFEYRISVVQDITDRKQAEESTRYGNSIIQSSDAAIIGKTLDGIITSWNPGAERLYGYTRKEILGQPISILAPPDQADEMPAILAQLRSGLQIADYETTRRKKDGTCIDVAVNISPILDKEGTIVGASSIARDITDRKRSEQALRNSEERLRLLIEYAPVALAMFDRNMRYIYASRRWRSDYNLGGRELLGLLHYDVFPEISEQWKEAHRRSLAGEVLRSEGERFVRADDSVQWVRWEMRPWQDSSGEVGGIVIFTEDITERKQAEEALRKGERRFRVLSEALPQLVWTTDAEGKVDYVNKRWTQYTGQPRTASLGAGWSGPLHPEDRAAAEAEWARAVRTGDQYTMEYRLRDRGGQYRWFLGRAIPLRTEKGQIERWFGTSTDIHEMKMAQQALIRSEKLASVGRMAMTIAHEINNPLAAVMNTLFLLRSEPGLSNSALNFVDLADSELRRISHITRQALGFYRESTTPEPASVNGLLESVTELLKSKIKAKHIVIDKKYREEITITAVGGELRQVFSNLLANAVDAVDKKGRISLRLSTSHDVEGHRTVRVIIADNGHGIAPSALPHIFEPFFTTKNSFGTGLGLWVSKQIVDKHKGCIRVRSRAKGEHHGTVFSVVLPMDTEGAHCPPTPVALVG